MLNTETVKNQPTGEVMLSEETERMKGTLERILLRIVLLGVLSFAAGGLAGSVGAQGPVKKPWQVGVFEEMVNKGLHDTERDYCLDHPETGYRVECFSPRAWCYWMKAKCADPGIAELAGK